MQFVLDPHSAHIPEQENEYVLPAFDSSPLGRLEEIETNKAGYRYGESLLGNTSVFPVGILGDAMVQKDKALWYQDVQYVTEQVTLEIHNVTRALAEVCCFPGMECLMLKRLLGRRTSKSVQFLSTVRKSVAENHSHRCRAWFTNKFL